jgi:hypothetical protein
VKIRRKDGKVLDLEEMRHACDRDGWTNAVAICDALEAALSVYKNVYGNKDCTFGYHTAIEDVREAAGVVEFE